MDAKAAYLITGASSGIGYATASKLSENPDLRVIALARNHEALQKLSLDSGNRIIPVRFDLEKQSPAELIIELEKLRINALDGIIHNAGKLVNHPYADLSAQALRSCYEVNVFAPFLITQALLPFLKKGNRPHVLHIGSVGGVQGSVKFQGLSAYSSSKGALAVLTECLALELESEGIRVNCLALGAVQTEMLAHAFPGYQAPVTAESMGEFVSWFLLNGHHFFNGKILPVALSTP